MGEEFEKMGTVFGSVTIWLYIIIAIITVVASLLVILFINMKKKNQKHIPRLISVCLIIAALVLIFSPFVIEFFF